MKSTRWWSGWMITTALVAVLASGCAASNEPESDLPETQQDGLSSRPCGGLIQSMDVATTITATIAASPETVYDYVVRRDTPARDIRGFGPVAGVASDRLLTPGGWDHPGARRMVFLEDGATLLEELDVLDRPEHFAYHVSDFSSVVKHFATGGRGEWFFAANGAGTNLAWTYTFRARSCIAEPELRLFAATFFRPYMKRALASIQQHIEEASGGAAAPPMIGK